MVSGGTWRRLKIASEVRQGHGVPRLPTPELERLLGLLAAIRDGRGEEAVADESVQSEAGAAERAGSSEAELPEQCRRLALAVDVRPFL